MKFPIHPPFAFALDPVSLTAIGLGLSGLGAAGGAAAQLLSRPKAPPVPKTPPTPAPAQQPAPPPTTGPAGGPSFLAAAATPPLSMQAGKTLLGQ